MTILFNFALSKWDIYMERTVLCGIFCVPHVCKTSLFDAAKIVPILRTDLLSAGYNMIFNLLSHLRKKYLLI